MKLLILLSCLLFAACEISPNQENKNCTSTIRCDDQSERFCDKAIEQHGTEGQCVDQICYLNYSEYCLEVVVCKEDQNPSEENE